MKENKKELSEEAKIAHAMSKKSLAHVLKVEEEVVKEDEKSKGTKILKNLLQRKDEVNENDMPVVKHIEGEGGHVTTYLRYDAVVKEVNSQSLPSAPIKDLESDAVEFMTWVFENKNYQWTGETWDENTGHDDFESLTHAELYKEFKNDLEEVSKPFPPIHFPEKEGMIYPEKEVNESQDELWDELIRMVNEKLYTTGVYRDDFKKLYSITRINTDKR